MCDPVTLTVVAVGATAAAGGYSAYNSYQQGVAQNKYYQYQAEQSRLEGQRALKIGEQQSNLVQDTAKEEGKQLASSQAEATAAQRAALAANGITGVTTEDIINNTVNKQQMDAAAIRYNADVKSWEINTGASYDNWAANVQATNYEYAGKSAKQAGKTQAIGTLLSTAASVAAIGATAGFGGGAKPTSLGTQTSKFGGGVNRYSGAPNMSYANNNWAFKLR